MDVMESRDHIATQAGRGAILIMGRLRIQWKINSCPPRRGVGNVIWLCNEQDLYENLDGETD